MKKRTKHTTICPQCGEKMETYSPIDVPTRVCYDCFTEIKQHKGGSYEVRKRQG